MMATDMIVNFCKYKTALYKIFINEQLGLCAVSFKCCSVFLRLWVVAFESLKTKEKISWAKSGRGPTSFPGFSPTRPTERTERTRLVAVSC